MWEVQIPGDPERVDPRQTGRGLLIQAHTPEYPLDVISPLSCSVKRHVAGSMLGLFYLPESWAVAQAHSKAKLPTPCPGEHTSRYPPTSALEAEVSQLLGWHEESSSLERPSSSRTARLGTGRSKPQAPGTPVRGEEENTKGEVKDLLYNGASKPAQTTVKSFLFL